MKGCLAVVGVLALLLVVLFAGCTGFLVYKGSQLGERHAQAMERLRATNVELPFTPPESGLLDPERVRVYLDARAGATGPVEALFAKTGDLRKMEEDPGDVGVFEAISTAFGAVQGIAQAVLEAPHALADSLQARGMSFAEYDWINGVVHGTIQRAAADGEEAAVALEGAITASFGNVQEQVRDDRYDQGVLAELGERIAAWEPENLALIAEHSEAIAGGIQVLLVDVFAVNVSDELRGGPESEEG